MTLKDAKLRVNALMEAPDDGGGQTEAISILYCVENAIRMREAPTLSADVFEDIYQDALIYTAQNFDTEKCNGKAYFNYFVDIVRYKCLDYRKKRHLSDVSLDAPIGDENGDSMGALVEGAEDFSEQWMEQEAAAEQILLLLTMVGRMSALLGGSRLERRNAYYRMFLTSRTVGAVRDGIDAQSVLIRHERDVLDALDRQLLSFTYIETPGSFYALTYGKLHRYGDILENHPKASQPLDVPFINKILREYLSVCHGMTISEAALSKQELGFSDFLQNLCAAS